MMRLSVEQYAAIASANKAALQNLSAADQLGIKKACKNLGIVDGAGDATALEVWAAIGRKWIELEDDGKGRI